MKNIPAARYVLLLGMLVVAIAAGLYVKLRQAAYAQLSEKLAVDREILSSPPVLAEEQAQRASTGCNYTYELQGLAAACDYTKPACRKLAVTLAAKDPGLFNLGQACDVNDYLRRQWRYVSDPVKGEYLAPASETLSTGLSGDCDDYAVLMSALLLAVGGHASVTYAYGPKAAHAYTEVNLGKADTITVKEYLAARYRPAPDSSGLFPRFVTGNIKFYLRHDASGQNWLNLDWSAADKLPGGPYTSARRRVVFDLVNGSCAETHSD